MYHFLFIVSFLRLTSSVKTMSDHSEINSTLLKFINTTFDLNVSRTIDKFKLSWPIKQWIELGYFSEEYIKDINVHWLRYPPPDDSSFYVIGTLYTIIMSIGILGNILVMYLFVR